MRKGQDKKSSTQKQNHERLSLYGQNPEEMIKAFMQVPLEKILERQRREKNKRE